MEETHTLPHPCPHPSDRAEQRVKGFLANISNVDKLNPHNQSLLTSPWGISKHDDFHFLDGDLESVMKLKSLGKLFFKPSLNFRAYEFHVMLLY